MRLHQGVLIFIVTLLAGLGFASAASAEFVKTDVDGDGKKDLVAASSPQAGTIRIGAFSSKKKSYSFLDFSGSGAAAPWILKKGDANGRSGSELFVRTGSNAVVDTIQVITFKGGKLKLGRSFFVNSAADDGLAIGIKCGQVKGAPGIRTYLFRLGKKGRWHRYVTPYGWENGRLVRRGKKTQGRVPSPSPGETGIGCPKPAAPPEPPPVLGSAGNRYLTGLGTVKPRSFKARHGTGRYFSFTWKNWGGAAATARGSFNVGTPGAGKKNMGLRAFDLGTCGGVRAYRKLTLRSGGHGVTLNVC